MLLFLNWIFTYQKTGNESGKIGHISKIYSIPMQLGDCWSQFKKSQTPQQLILLILFCLAHSQVSHCEIQRWHVGVSVRTGKIQLWMRSTPVKNVFSAVDASWICRDSIKAILKRGMGGVGRFVPCESSELYLFFLTSLVGIIDTVSICRTCFAFILKPWGLRWCMTSALSDLSCSFISSKHKV